MTCCRSSSLPVSFSTRRLQLLEDEAAAIHGLTSDDWPLADPVKLNRVVQQLHSVQQDMTFQANMSTGIQMAATTSR